MEIKSLKNKAKRRASLQQHGKLKRPSIKTARDRTRFEVLKIKEFTNPNSDYLSSLSVSPLLLNRVQVFDFCESKKPKHRSERGGETLTL